MMNRTDRYTLGAVLLHWSTGAFIVANLALGFAMVWVAPRSFRPILVPLHACIGLTVLLLTIARIAWRVSHPAPPMPATYRAWERNLAHCAHAIFYVLLIALPVLGYLLLSANPPNPARKLQFWGIIQVPFFRPLLQMEPISQKILHDQFVVMHSIAAWAILLTLVLHIAGVVKHQVLDRENILSRMAIVIWPGGARERS